MTYDQIHECIKNGNKMTTNQLYQDLEQLDVMLSYTYRNLTNAEHNLVIATKLFLEYQLSLREESNG